MILAGISSTETEEWAASAWSEGIAINSTALEIRAILTVPPCSLEIVGVDCVGRAESRPASQVKFETKSGESRYTQMTSARAGWFVGIAFVAEAVDAGFETPAHVRKRASLLSEGDALKAIGLDGQSVIGSGRHAASGEDVGQVESAWSEIIVAQNDACGRE